MTTETAPNGATLSDRIKTWLPEDRPREKLVRMGASALTDAELIAIILGTGTRTSSGPVSAVRLGMNLIQRYRTLDELSQRQSAELRQVHGIGTVKAVQLVAAFELGRRVESSTPDERVQISCPADVAAAFGPGMRGLKHEVFKVAYLNTANEIIGDAIISAGGLAASIVEPRAVFRQAILENAAAIICLHNHPSENPEPSREDIRITRQLVDAGRIVGVPLHDHIIIAGKRFTSFAERGLID